MGRIKFWLFGSVTIMVIVLVSGCIGGIEGILGPSPVVVQSNCKERVDLFDVYVTNDVLVTNKGRAGEVIVKGEFISKKGITYSDTKTIYMDAGESKYVHFHFDTSWGEGGVCSTSARAKK